MTLPETSVACSPVSRSTTRLRGARARRAARNRRARLLPLTNGSTTSTPASWKRRAASRSWALPTPTPSDSTWTAGRCPERSEPIEHGARAGGGVAVGEDADSATVEQALLMGPSDVGEVDEILRGADREQPRVGAPEDRARHGVDVDHRDVVRLGQPHRAVREVAGADHRQHAIAGELVGHRPLVVDAGRAERAEHGLDRTAAAARQFASSAASSAST